jgi:tetratricopeptide (TPR) repeat protein
LLMRSKNACGRDMPERGHPCLKIALALLIAAALGLLSVSFALHPNEAGFDKLFIEGNNSYKQGNYSEALKFYEQLLSAKGNDPVVLYNAANASVKTNNTGKAVLYYERARRLWPRDRDVAENLRRIEPAVNRVSPFFLVRPLFSIRDFFTINELTVIADAVLFITLCMVILFLLVRKDHARHLLSRLTRASLLVLLIALTFFAWRVYDEQVLHKAVVIADKAIARSGPGEQFLEVLELPAGAKVRIVDRSAGEWVRIRLRDGRSGYLPSSVCEEI